MESQEWNSNDAARKPQSLRPLDFEQALSGLLATRPPPRPKKTKEPKARRKRPAPKG